MKGCMQYNRSYEPSGDLTVIISGKLKSRESQVLKGNECTCTVNTNLYSRSAHSGQHVASSGPLEHVWNMALHVHYTPGFPVESSPLERKMKLLLCIFDVTLCWTTHGLKGRGGEVKSISLFLNAKHPPPPGIPCQNMAKQSDSMLNWN